MATHSSVIAWEVLWIEEPGGLQSMGSLRVRHYLATEHMETSCLYPGLIAIKLIVWYCLLKIFYLLCPWHASQFSADGQILFFFEHGWCYLSLERGSVFLLLGIKETTKNFSLSWYCTDSRLHCSCDQGRLSLVGFQSWASSKDSCRDLGQGSGSLSKQRLNFNLCLSVNARC